MKAASLGAAVLVAAIGSTGLTMGPAHTASATAAAFLNASPNPVSAGPSGLGTTTISWDTGDGSVGEVWVDDEGDNASEALFARAAAGTQDAPWIQTGHTYVFALYQGVAHGTRLATVAVTRPGVGISARPQQVPGGSGLGTTTISWDTGDGSVGEVWVDDEADNAGEVLFARAGAGTQDAPWIQTGHRYGFALYQGVAHGTRLATVVVTRPGVAISASPQWVPAGPGLGTTTISWDTADGSVSEVWVDDMMDSAGEALFARSAAGTQDAPWIQSSRQYMFRLYQGMARNVVLGNVRVSRGPDLIIRGVVQLNDTSGPGLANVGIYVYLGGPPVGGSPRAQTRQDGSFQIEMNLQGMQEQVTVRPELSGYSFDPPSYSWTHYWDTIDQRAVGFVARAN